MERKISEGYEFKVLISCNTFNHAKYIKDTLYGFASQRTNFPYACFVLDDASTDGAQNVIQEWLEKECDMSKVKRFEQDLVSIIIAPLINNDKCTFIIYLLKENFYGKPEKSQFISEWQEECTYVAVCEGDDYWIDPCKLQLQVDCLDANSNCTLVGTNGIILWERGEKFPSLFRHTYDKVQLTIEDIVESWQFPTASLMFRKDIFFDRPKWMQKIYSTDQSLALVSIHKGIVVALPNITCVYRKTLDGKSASNRADSNRSYVIEQHQLLYTEFDKWTNGCYQELIAEVLHNEELEKQYIQRKKRHVIIPLLLMPKFTITRYVQKYKRFKKIIEKR